MAKVRTSIKPAHTDDVIEITKECINCFAEISQDEYNQNNGKCNDCVAELLDDFTQDNNGTF
jgi:hypothetical protein